MKSQIKKLELPRDEMAFRKEYRELLERKKLTIVFRPGDRVCPAWRCYSPGEIVTARVIEKPGNDDLMIPPQFYLGLERKIQIEEIEARNVDELEHKDFVGSSTDVHDIVSLRDHLTKIYNIDPREIKTVTRIQFKYL